MDLSSADTIDSQFFSEDFDCTDFLNKSLASSTNPDTADVILSNTLVRLHLFAQSLSARADAAMTGMVSAMPRARRDAKNTATEAAFLSSQLRALAAAGAESSNEYVRELEQLDSVSRRLMSVQSTLADAALWERLVRETENALSGFSNPREDDSGNDSSLETISVKQGSGGGVLLARMATHLASLERAAETLKEMPDAQSRFLFLEKARKSFYSQAAPQLVLALRSDDEVSICAVAQIYNSLGHMDVFRNIFARTRVAPLTALWAQAPIDAGSLASNGAPSRFALSLATQLGAAGGSSTAKTSSFSTWLELFHRGVSTLALNDAQGLVNLFIKIAESVFSSSSLISTENTTLLDKGRSDAVKCLSLMLTTALGAQTIDSSSISVIPETECSGLQHLQHMNDADSLLSYDLTNQLSETINLKDSTSQETFLRSASVEAYHSRMDDEYETKQRRLFQSTSSSLSSSSSTTFSHAFYSQTSMVVPLHDSAVKAAHDISAVISAMNAPSIAEVAALNAIYTSLSAPFERSVIRLDDDEREALLSIASSMPSARLPLSFPSNSNDKQISLAATSLCAVLGVTNNSGISSQGVFSNNSLVSTTSSIGGGSTLLPTVSDAADACSAIEEVVKKASSACTGYISRVDQLTLLSRASTLSEKESPLVAFIIDLSQRLYATAAALHDSTVLPLVTAAAAQRAAAAASILSTRDNATVGAGTVTRSSIAGSIAGTSVASLASAAAAKSSSSTSSTLSAPLTNTLLSQGQGQSTVVLPPLRDVYATSLRLILLGVDLFTLSMALSCTIHETLKIRKPTLLSIRDTTTATTAATSLPISTTTRAIYTDLRLWEVEKALRKDVQLSSSLKKLLTHIPSPQILFADAFKAVEQSTLHLHRIVYESLLAPIASCLKGVRSLSVWKGTTVTTSSNEYDHLTNAHLLDSADGGFSVQPSAYATSFCEHLLSLVQLISPPGHPMVQTVQRAVLLHGASSSASTAIPSRMALSSIVIQAIDTSTNTNSGTVDHSIQSSQNQNNSLLPFRASLAIYAQITALSVPQLGFAEISAVYDMLGAGQAPSFPSSVSVGGVVGGRNVVESDNETGSSGPLATLNVLAASFDTLQFSEWVRENIINSSNSSTLSSSSLSSSSSSTSTTSSSSTTTTSGYAITTGEVADETSAVAIAAATLWLHGIARGAIALLLSELCRIPHLDCRTNGPLQQLRADTSYVRAVLSSMGIEVDPLFSRFVDLATLSVEELDATLRSSKDEVEDPIEIASRRAVVKIRK
jgi:hypothetical protein